MSFPNSSIKKQADATGTDLAVNVANSKTYEVIKEAGPTGEVIGTRDSYIVIQTPGVVGAANKLWFDLWNGSGSNKTIELHGVWMNSNMDVATAATLAYRFDLFRTTAIGTGGNTFSEASALPRSVSRIKGTDGAPLPAQVTMRDQPTGGATSGRFIGQAFIFAEEASTSMGYQVQFFNWIRYAQSEDMSDIVIPQNTGIKIVQGPVAANIGFVGYRLVFTTREP